LPSLSDGQDVLSSLPPGMPYAPQRGQSSPGTMVRRLKLRLARRGDRARTASSPSSSSLKKGPPRESTRAVSSGSPACSLRPGADGGGGWFACSFFGGLFYFFPGGGSVYDPAARPPGLLPLRQRGVPSLPSPLSTRQRAPWTGLPISLQQIALPPAPPTLPPAVNRASRAAFPSRSPSPKCHRCQRSPYRRHRTTHSSQ